MKKKNLIILLIIPFLISLIGVITINVSINTFYGDITSIDWDYDDVEAFKLSDKKYELKASAYNASNAPLDAGNSLIWKCENVDTTYEDPIAEIVYENEKYYLNTITTGEVVITCSNLKGNIFRKMTAVIYQDGVIIVTPVISSSQSNIDDDIYYGEYDLENGNKVNATFDINIRCIPSQISSTLTIADQTDNIIVNLNGKKVTIKESGDASFTISSSASSIEDVNFKFKIVENGVNVYDYEDLLECTNKSENGEIVVLRKSFESSDTLAKSTANNIVLFGTSKGEKEYNFANEVYTFETTYNQEYIKQWNNFANQNSKYNKISNQLVAGLRIQKDFYGNGYTINMHNLTYPYGLHKIEGYEVPYLEDENLFRGPLSFYTLGDPNDTPLVSAYGQDNVGMYIDGNNITVNDVNIRNCDLTGSLSFLDTVGVVVEVNGDNNTIINSRLSNGKNILRCFSTENFTLENSLLSNSRNFLMEVGSNEYMSYDEVTKYDFVSSTGSKTTANLPEYFGPNDKYVDADITNYMMGSFNDSGIMRESLNSIQNALNQNGTNKDNYKGTMTIKDTYFYSSGIASIALESMFNGPFLYKPVPSQVTQLLSSMSSEGKQIIPYTPTKVGGVSYPVKVNLEGDTKFYDYKDTSNIDITGLIDENISEIAMQVFDEEKNINVDTIFPIKPYLLSGARAHKSTYSKDGTEYINIPIAYYGGGLNLSTVNIENLNNNDQLSEEIEVDFLDHYLTPSSGGDLMSQLKDIMLKCVTIVTGFEPFKFVFIKGNGYLYGETPNVENLINNAKEV